MNANRTTYVVRNIYIGMLCQVFNAGLGFVVRYFFTSGHFKLNIVL